MNKKTLLAGCLAVSMLLSGFSAFAQVNLNSQTGAAIETKISTDKHAATYQLADGSYRLELKSTGDIFPDETGKTPGVQATSLSGNAFYRKTNFHREPTMSANAVVETITINGANLPSYYQVAYIKPNYALPENANITKAEMVIYTANAVANTNTRVADVLGPWEQSTVTWDNQPGFYGNAFATQNTSKSNTKYIFDLTSVVHFWQKQGADWGGISLYTYSQQTTFHSPRAQNEAMRPSFNIYYTVNNATPTPEPTNTPSPTPTATIAPTSTPTPELTQPVNVQGKQSDYYINIVGELKGDFPEGSNTLTKAQIDQQQLSVTIINTKTGIMETKGTEAIEALRVNVVNGKIIGYRIYGPAQTTDSSKVMYTLSWGNPV